MSQRIDWFRIITDLERSGFSLERIGDECMRSKTWAWSLKNVPNTEPRFHDGMLLLGIWEERTGKKHAEAPRTEEFAAR